MATIAATTITTATNKIIPVNTILQGDSLTRLRELPSDSIDCCVTSPPYWGLRDYKSHGQLGSEKHFNEYLDKLIEIFAEVKRIIKPTGSIFVNIGDTYAGTGHKRNARQQPKRNEERQGQLIALNNKVSGIPNKSLCGIPERFSIRMTDELQLVRRNTIIWYKPNCMPSSAGDRFTVDFEYVYFFTKTQKYYFETQYEPHSEIDVSKINNAIKMGWNGQSDYNHWYFNERKKTSWHSHEHDKEQGYGQQTRGQKPPIIHHPLGRLKRTVWKVPVRGFKDAHFAVYPTQLIEPILAACCPSQICTKCGFMRKLVYEPDILVATRPYKTQKPNVKSRTQDDPNQLFHKSKWSTAKVKVIRRLKEMGADSKGDYNGQSTKDYDSAKAQNASDTKRRILESYIKRANSKYVMTSCKCNEPYQSGIILDPFMGSGTSAVVALQQGKNFVGIELNPEYIKIAQQRLKPLLEQTKLTNF